ASIKEDGSLDMTLRLVNSAVVSTAEKTSGVAIMAVEMPGICIAEDPDISEQDVLVLGSLMGDCTRNPIKHLDSPRWNSESINHRQYRLHSDIPNYKFYK